MSGMRFAWILATCALLSGCGGGKSTNGGSGPGGTASGPGGGTSGSPGQGGAATGPGQGGSGTSGTGGAGSGGDGTAGGSAAGAGQTTTVATGPFVGNGGAANLPGLVTPPSGMPGGGNYDAGPICEALLSGFSYSCPSTPPDTSGIFPEGSMCFRDGSVAGALIYCWAAKCYGANDDANTCPLGSCDEAAEAAKKCAYEQLCVANDLCGGVVVGEPVPCNTLNLWGCDGDTGTVDSRTSQIGCPNSCPLAAAATSFLEWPTTRKAGSYWPIPTAR